MKNKMIYLKYVSPAQKTQGLILRNPGSINYVYAAVDEAENLIEEVMENWKMNDVQ